MVPHMSFWRRLHALHCGVEKTGAEANLTLVLLLAAGWSTDIGNVDDEVSLLCGTTVMGVMRRSIRDTTSIC